PLPHRDGSAHAHLRDDLEVVHQPSRAGKSKAQASARRKAVTHRLLDVGNAWSLVARHDAHPAATAVLDDVEGNIAVLRVDHDVAGDLRDRRRDQGQVAALESDLRRESAADLTGHHHVFVARYGDPTRLTHARDSSERRARSSSMASSRSSAVDTAPRSSPSWTIANATSG